MYIIFVYYKMPAASPARAIFYPTGTVNFSGIKSSLSAISDHNLYAKIHPYSFGRSGVILWFIYHRIWEKFFPQEKKLIFQQNPRYN